VLRGNFNQTGGVQVNWDDFYFLQDQLFKSIELQYLGSGAFILQGCNVTGAPGNYTISNGLVYIDGKVLQFSTVTGVTAFPRYIKQATPVPQDSFTLEQGGTAYKRVYYKSELASSAPGSGEYIIMSASGGRNYNDVLANQFVRLSGNQIISGTKSFTSTISGSINGNAATATNATSVTNGVYTIGDQTIAGSKTFTSTISGNLSGNVTGNVTGNLTGNASTATNATFATSAGNASTATNASFATNAGNSSTVTDGVYASSTQTITGSKTFSQPVVASGINTDNVVLKTKVIPVGDVNYQVDLLATVAHGLNVDQIRSVTGIFRSDTQDVYIQLGGSFNDSYISFINSTHIFIGFGTNQLNNSANWNATSYNRGWLTIVYEP
jgi:hypothetical protein